MFTGIIQEIGSVVERKMIGGGIQFAVHAVESSRELRINDSVAINGVCQTVINKTEETFTVEAVEETLRKTTLGELQQGNGVNLELPMKLGDRVGGHLVLGHVDGVGVIAAREKKPSSWVITVEFPEEFSRFVVPVGSVAMDGISLTVASLKGATLTVSIIPHTLEKTTLSRVSVGARVNLEFDILGKYVDALLRKGEEGNPLSWERLREWGYNA